MTGQAQVPVPTTARATQHIRLPHTHDAYEHLCVLTVTIKPGPSPPLCWQIHRCLAVPVPTLRLWVHCPRASDGLLPPRLYLIGYVRWDARSNHSSLLDNHVQQLTDRTVPVVCPIRRLEGLRQVSNPCSAGNTKPVFYYLLCNPARSMID